MIAPIEGPRTSATSPGIRCAHLLVASTLLKQRPGAVDNAPRVPARRAWLLTAWVVVVVAVYFACMAGLL